MISLLGVENLSEDIRNSNPITNDVASNHDILLDGRSPADNDGIGQRANTQRRRMIRNFGFCEMNKNKNF